MNRRIHLMIQGVVQGVFFRVHVKKQAEVLGLTGWAKNRADGSVEVVAEGPEPELKRLEQWSHIGSPASDVEEVDVQWGNATGEFSTFSIR